MHLAIEQIIDVLAGSSDQKPAICEMPCMQDARVGRSSACLPWWLQTQSQRLWPSGQTCCPGAAVGCRLQKHELEPAAVMMQSQPT